MTDMEFDIEIGMDRKEYEKTDTEVDTLRMELETVEMTDN